jgi:ribosomal-protein-alanine N-acetyltransferase
MTKLNTIYKPGKNIVLKKLSYDYIDDIFEYSQDKEFFKFLSSSVHKSLDDTRKYIDFLFSRINDIDSKNEYWYIIKQDEDKAVGTMGILNITSKEAELAYGMGLKYAGKGYIQNAILQIQNYVFNELKLDRLYGGTNKDNTLVIQTLKSMGFQEDIKKTNNIYWYYEMTQEYYNQEHVLVANDIKLDIKDIVKIVSTILDDNLDITSTMEDSFTWDSLNHILIIEKLSKEYNIKFKPKDVVKATSIENIYQIIKSKL